MPKAHADLPMPRALLRDPSQRLRAREALYRMLARLGTVDPSSLRYYRDPLDGPLREQGLPNDETAVVRAEAFVTPRES